MRQTQYDAIVIGAGHNGLVTAAYLAKEGLSVLVLERQDIIGGACVTEQLYPGFYVPYCAYICYLLQGKVIDDLELKEHGLEIIPSKYDHFQPFPDGSYIQTSENGAAQEDVQEIARFSDRDAQRFGEWEAFWERVASILHRYWLKEPPSLAQVFEDVRGTTDEQVLETMLTVSARGLLDRYFESDHVKTHLLNTDAGDPSAPGSALNLAYFECSRFSKPENIGIPRGSMGAITQAMASSARSCGAEIRTGTRVEKVMVDEGVAKGVRLADGEELTSWLVISNADPKRTYQTLVDSEHLSKEFIKEIADLTTGMNSIKFLAALRELPDFQSYLGWDYSPERIAQIKICPSLDYYQQSWEDCKNGLSTMCPILDIQIPSIYDSALAPPGQHVLSCWGQYYPAELKNETWDQASKEIGQRIIDIVTEYAPNFRDSIIDWTVQTPKDIEVREGMTDGNIRHIDIAPHQLFSRRVSYRSPIRHLYLCGAGTHPGGEVTGAPGHNAAKVILKDLSKVAEPRPVG